MTTPFLDPLAPAAPADLIKLAQGFAPPRVAIARAASPLPMETPEDATKAGRMTPVFIEEADVLMKGQLHTDVFMKSALKRNAGLRTGQRLASAALASLACGFAK